MLLNPDLSLLTRDSVFVDDTKSLAEWDGRFGRFMSVVSYTVGVPTAVLTNSGQVDLLAQHVGDDTPTLLFLLHPCLRSQARYLAITTPTVELLESGDLRSMGSSLVWRRGPYDLTLPGWFVEQEVARAAFGPLADVENIGGTRGGYLAGRRLRDARGDCLSAGPCGDAVAGPAVVNGGQEPRLFAGEVADLILS